MLGIQVPVIYIEYHQSAAMNKYNIAFVNGFVLGIFMLVICMGLQISGDFHMQSLQSLPELDPCM